MAFLYSLFFTLLPTLLICVAISVALLYRRRKHPNLAVVFNFKRPFWLALFISLGMIVLGFIGLISTPTLFHFLHIHYEKLGLQDVTCMAFILLIFTGAFCCMASAIYCLWRLIAAILSYVRAKQNYKK